MKFVEESSGPRASQRLQRHFLVGHAALFGLLIWPAVAIFFAVARGEDARYFGGYIQLALLLLVPLACALPFLHVCIRPQTWLVAGSLWIPIVAIWVAAFTYWLRFWLSIHVLSSSSCGESSISGGLEQALVSADTLYETCRGAVRSSSTGHNSSLEVTGVKECPGFDQLASEQAAALHFLESLEMRYPCAGFCKDGRRLFEEPGRWAPACAPMAASALQAPLRMTSALLVYVLLAAACVATIQFTFVPPLVQRVEDTLLQRAPMV
mmetsp:Transcript_83091/g.173941  ORF Transcript_83091/g.173941 Transcript_83091/m.173941 type:complete len:266 (-) Transcript_83091:63-860(-)